MTKDNAVLFCWLNGNKFKKRSTTELVHHHLVQTSKKMHSMHARRKKGTETQQITDNMLEDVMRDSFVAFRREADLYSLKYQCGGCLEQCTGRKSFRFCERCRQGRYCSEDCPKSIGKNPIAMNASNCEGSLEVGLCLKAHWALVAEQTLVFLSITRALHSTASLGARFYTECFTFCPAHENQAMCMWPCVVAKLNITICLQHLSTHTQVNTHTF